MSIALLMFAETLICIHLSLQQKKLSQKESRRAGA